MSLVVCRRGNFIVGYFKLLGFKRDVSASSETNLHFHNATAFSALSQVPGQSGYACDVLFIKYHLSHISV